MKKMLTLVLFLFASMAVMVSQVQDTKAAYPDDIEVIINYSTFPDGTESNVATPQIPIICIGLNETYDVNITSNGTLLVQQLAVVNNTPTNITLSTIGPGSYVNFNVSCRNDTSISLNATTGTWWGFERNAQPVIDEGVTTSGVTTRGQDVTFTISSWTDRNSSDGDADTGSMTICSTNSYTAGTYCGGTQLCNSTTHQTDHQDTCSYTVPLSATGGNKDFYAFVEDDNQLVSLVISGVYTVAGYVEEDDTQTGGSSSTGGTGNSIVTTSIGGIPLIWVIIGIILILIGTWFFIRSKNK